MALADDPCFDPDPDLDPDVRTPQAPAPVKSRCWLCCTCGHVRTSPMPASVAAPCVRCAGLDFETVPQGTVRH